MVEYDPEAGTLHEDGVLLFPRRYADGRVITVLGANGRKYTPRRLAWELYYGHPPPSNIILNDGNEENIRLSNLRAVSREEISNRQHALHGPRRVREREERERKLSEQASREQKERQDLIVRQRIAVLTKQMEEGRIIAAELAAKETARKATTVDSLLAQGVPYTTTETEE